MMTDIVYALLGGVSVFFIAYLLIYATFLFISVAVGAFKLYKRDRMTRFRNELKHGFYMPITIVVPAYNEEVTIVDSVKTFLTLDYRLFEVVVVDDGSKDDTAAELIKAYNLSLTHRPVRRVLKCQPATEVYEAQIGKVKLTLIRKVNGGKGDALNMGINASQYPYFICVDADSMLQRDSLEKIAQPVMEDDTVVAVGGLIRVAQCVTFDEDGKVSTYRLPKNLIVCMQVMEYDRSFMASRILLDLFNGNLIVSGAFGLFKKSTVIAAGGYNPATLGEDMDLIVRLHVYCRNSREKYAIRYEPNAVCWSQAPTSLGDLGKQRRRWNLGLFQCMINYRQLFSNLRFGMVSFVSYMYYLFYELLSPFIEVFGILTVIISSIFGLLNTSFMLQFFILYTVYGAVLSITAFYQRIYTQNLRVSPSDLVKALLMCILEIGFFRYFISFIRVASFFTYKKRKGQWGSIKRVKHDGSKT
ncbi:MAG: glycosyltransferase [Oscillospiraceae bacterium]|jgi:cellulose synthase/poly-beta-1,6-N-acetylglucosamine synthase-like glycosyltransferase|nr:glycosyltransferase [Oscillospiraceae bacterium]